LRTTSAPKSLVPCGNDTLTFAIVLFVVYSL